MGLKDYQNKIIRQFQTQELLLADLYTEFGRRFPEDRDFWDQLVREETMHARLIEKLHDVVKKGSMIFDEGKVKTYTLTAMIERIEALVQGARRGDLNNRREALAQALDLESALIEKGVFTHFEPMTDNARAVLKRLNSETLDHVVRVRRMHAGARPAPKQQEETEGIPMGDPRIQWTPALSVGIEEIDNQHRNLFDLINRATAMQASSGRFEAVSDLIREMIRYSDEHFKTEDAVMIGADFPLFATHRREHQKYMEKIRVFVDGIKGERQDLIEEILDFLAVWWLEHITESDSRYARWLQSQETDRS
ncbi:MAG: hemerythrin family protein [Desulfobacterales bacterium]|nr:hemerythrin family protein [Desulfobacterales bacterium]